jgi:hypothetical protein
MNKKETYDGLTYANKGLALLNNPPLFHKNKNLNPKDFLSADVSLYYLGWYKANVAFLYNAVEQYTMALNEGIKEMEFLFSDISNPHLNLHTTKIISDIEYTHAFLRKGKLLYAQKKLSDTIKKCKMLRKKALLSRALVYEMEVLVKLFNFDIVYANYKYLASIPCEEREANNYANLLFISCHYHAAVTKYKQEDCELSLKHFSEFFTHMNDFCKGFLDKPVYDKLISENTFEIIKDKLQIQKCLGNSLKIFTAIYGKNNSFVKDYVAENCKNRSWIYEKLKILGYYLEYYWDCCKEFCGMEII